MTNDTNLSRTNEPEQAEATPVDGPTPLNAANREAQEEEFPAVDECTDDYPDHDSVPDDFDVEEDESVLIDVRKPKKDQWFWIHPEMRGAFDLIADPDDDRKLYRPNRRIRDKYKKHLKRMLLVACITRSGAVFLWPISTTDNSYSRSAILIAKTRHSRWLQCRADIPEKAYRITSERKKTGSTNPPKWPTEDFEKLVREAFSENEIKSEEHRVLAKLRKLSGVDELMQ